MQIKIQRCQYPWNLDYPFPYKKNKIINQDTKCAISSLLPPIIKNHDRVFLFKGGVMSRIERVPKTRVERHVSASCRTVGWILEEFWLR